MNERNLNPDCLIFSHQDEVNQLINDGVFQAATELSMELQQIYFDLPGIDNCSQPGILYTAVNADDTTDAALL